MDVLPGLMVLKGMLIKVKTENWFHKGDYLCIDDQKYVCRLETAIS